MAGNEKANQAQGRMDQKAKARRNQQAAQNEKDAIKGKTDNPPVGSKRWADKRDKNK